MGELVERLRAQARRSSSRPSDTLLWGAADELTALRERVAELENAARIVVDCLTPDATKIGHLRAILAKQGGEGG